MRKIFLNFIFIFIIGIFGGIFADQIFWPYFIERPLFYEYRLEKSPIYITETKEIRIEENSILQSSFEKVQSSIIGVKSVSSKSEIKGSGIVITNDGLIVTLAELVPVGYTFDFYINEKSFPYQILKRDNNLNLALIKLDGDGFLPLGFKAKEDLRIGERVFLAGFLSLNNNFSKSINEGIIKRTDEKYVYTNIFENDNLKGSTLFNMWGEIVGINMIDKKGEVFSIPSNVIKDFSGF